MSSVPSLLQACSLNKLCWVTSSTPKRTWVQEMLPKCSPRYNQGGCRSGSMEGRSLPRKMHLNLSQKKPKALSLTSHSTRCVSLLLTNDHSGPGSSWQGRSSLTGSQARISTPSFPLWKALFYLHPRAGRFGLFLWNHQ